MATLFPFVVECKIGERDLVTGYVSLMSVSENQALKDFERFRKRSKAWKDRKVVVKEVKLVVYGDKVEHENMKRKLTARNADLQQKNRELEVEKQKMLKEKEKLLKKKRKNEKTSVSKSSDLDEKDSGTRNEK